MGKDSVVTEKSMESGGLHAAFSEHDQYSAPEVSCAELGTSSPEVAKGTAPQVSVEDKHAYYRGYPVVEAPLPTPKPPVKPHRRRKLIVFFVFLGVSTILAIILGAYFGSRLKNHRSRSSPGAVARPADGSSRPGSNGGSSSTGVPAFALNGTALASVSYDAANKYNADTSQENYVVFYQHSSGDIRKIVWNQTTWYPSEFVTGNARMGTGLSALSFGAPPSQIYLYYIDKTGILQELRGAHASDAWTNGTLGTAGFKATDSYSSLSAKYQGRCGKRGNMGWVHYQTDAGVQEILWDHDQDSWSSGTLFKDIQPGSDLVSTIEASTITAWRMYGINRDMQLQEYVCNTPCANATNPWLQGITGSPPLTPSTSLPLAGAAVNNSRLLYYLSPTSEIHELNNTDFSLPTGLSEGWVANASTLTSGNDHTNVGTQSSVSGDGLVVAQAMKGSRMSMVQGWRGLMPQMLLFYQANGTDVSVRVRLEDQVGSWGDPVALPVGA